LVRFIILLGSMWLPIRLIILFSIFSFGTV
jgi:hypothetical protein